MLTRAWAAWLILLVLSPFTAPFSVFDAGPVFGRTQERRAPIAAFSPEKLVTWRHVSNAMLLGVSCIFFVVPQAF